jgi:hypothetical protein
VLKRSVLHVPHSDMLASQTIGYWIDRFVKATKIRPTEVTLPGIDYRGPAFDSQVIDFPNTLEEGNLLPDWVREVRNILGDETKVWVSIVTALPFLEVETVMLRDQYGFVLDQACINNETVQKVIDTFIEEMLRYGIDGITLTLADIYPNSGSDSLQGIQNTCFCSYCLSDLKLEGWHYGIQPFLDNNITRFALRLTETGAIPLEPRYQWIRDTDTNALIQYSRARGFLEEEFTAENSTTEVDAARALQYFATRSRVVARAVRRLGETARANDKSVAVILGDEYLDMSTLTDLATLVQVEAADQYWLPAINDELLKGKGIDANQYLFARGTYTIDSFFETVASADTTIAMKGVEFFIQRLLKTSSTMTRANKMNTGAILTVRLNDEYSGFVGVPISQTDVVRYVDNLTQGTFGQIVPRQVINQIIEQVKLTSPSAT